ncbi:metabolite traffic protein EboE [Flavobacteriaceae bacterium F89]|uniref:Metabolite traffic protein EboE n=1 Tax=Cerina litoralis TaxID=2874477 RepID=A0AAE3EX10_9FLAO|nr:metabolite traffic protein EboE [Cerina litoralis]MCG2461853.1 metabolite traffic protein EboE [Cerina litoralis]
MLVDNNYHLSYCTNIHPGENWERTLESLKSYVPRIKAEVSPDRPFGIGLRLSNTASEELTKGYILEHFKKWLDENNLYVFTMNGFPYGNFHNQRVKEEVHAPDWTTEERLRYTNRLFDQLAFLLPEGMSGGISTSPISYKHWHNSFGALDLAFTLGAEHLVQVVVHLWEVEERTGKHLHLDIEPEPDGLLENSDEVIHFFENYLIPMAKVILAREQGIDGDRAQSMVLRYIAVCYDVCHFSLAYEEPGITFKKLANHGIQVGKIQVSAALKIIFDADNKGKIWEALAEFNEPTYLHQVTEKIGDEVRTYSDLPVVLEEKRDFKELRAHFHVPIFLDRFGLLQSTQDQILKVIAYLKDYKITDQLEIETYTWDVLPPDLKAPLDRSIIREIQWLKNKL